MSIQLFKELLENIEKPEVVIKNHALLRIKERNLDYNKIIENLSNPTNLTNSILQVETEFEKKFLNTYQEKGKSRYCYIVSIQEYKIILITAYRQDIRKTKIFNKFVK